MNLARFAINSDPSTSGGCDVLSGDPVSFVLEAVGGLVRKTEFWVYSSSDSESPLASKDAPSLVLVGAASGNRVQASTPNAAVTTMMPAGTHSWIVRCVVNDGINLSDGSINPDYTFERMLSIRSGSSRRKIVATEGTQYSPRGWADAQNEDVDAVSGTSIAGSTSILISGGFASCITGTTAGKVCAADDPRVDHTSTGVAQVAMAIGSPVALMVGGGLMPAAFGLARVSGILLNGSSGAGPTLTYQYFGPSIPIPYGVWFDKPVATDIGKPVYSLLDASFILTLTKPVSGPYQEIGTVLFADAGANTTTIMINLQSEMVALR